MMPSMRGVTVNAGMKLVPEKRLRTKDEREVKIEAFQKLPTGIAAGAIQFNKQNIECDR